MPLKRGTLTLRLCPDPDGGLTVTFRNLPEAIAEGDTRDEAVLSIMAANIFATP